MNRIVTMAAVSAFAAAAASNEQILLEKIGVLEQRLAAVEKKLQEPPAAPPAKALEQAAKADPFGSSGTTVNGFFDGYYTWNANRPEGAVNPLRAYDVTSNGFSINQTGMVMEHAVDPAAGRRWGYRLDLLYGQATATLQGSRANENRPGIYRNVFQAYGTYVIPLGNGITSDFGKWASALGAEGNYTKDQINYSRSYFFNFLPFYHMGFRNTYAFNGKLSAAYWLVNGANQTEDFNGFKSHLGQAVVRPSRNLTWTLNYYNGREQRGLAPRRGRLHVIDTYAFWNPTGKLTLGGEADYVVNRVEAGGPPQRVTGGAAYFRYQLTARTYFGQRYTRLNDHSGLFSGTTQNLNDLTSTLGIRPDDGFEARLEYRRDFSNTPYFPQNEPGVLRRHQDTLTLGLLWWFGGKAGGW